MKTYIVNRGAAVFLPIFLMFFLTAAIPVFSAGNTEINDKYDPRADYEKVNELIEQGSLDEAINLLVEIAKNDPEQMERVQKLVLEIRNIKSNVNELFKQLNEAILQGNEDEAYRLIKEIKDTDTDPNRNTLNDLILAAIVVGKTHNDSVRDKIYERGNIQLAAENYTSAVSIYRTGFINPEYLEFYDEYLELAKDKVEIVRYQDDPERQKKIWEAYSTVAPEGNKQIESIQEALDTWDRNAAGLNNNRTSALNGIASLPPQEWKNQYADFTDSLSSVEKDITALIGLSKNLDSVKKELYAILDGIPEDFRYERILEFINGRKGKEGKEGILLAQKLNWENSYLDILLSMNTKALELIKKGRESYLNGNISNASDLLRTASGALTEAADFSAVKDNYINKFPQTGNAGFTDVCGKSSAFGKTALLAIPYWQNLIEIKKDLPDINLIDFETVDLAEINRISDYVQNSIDKVINLQNSWNSAFEKLSSLPFINTDNSAIIASNISTDLQNEADDLSALRLNLYVKALQPLYDNLEKRTDATKLAELNNIKQMIDPEVKENELPDRHPSRALDDFIDPAYQRLTETENRIKSFLSVLDEILNIDPPLADPSKIKNFENKADNLLVEISDNKTTLNSLRENALNYRHLALKAETSARNIFKTIESDMNAANAAVSRGRTQNDIDEFYKAIDLYNGVEESLDRVDKLYLEILVNDADIAEKSGINELRNSWRTRVQDSRSKLAVTVKMNAVEEAKKSYSDGLYNYGLSVLLQSQDFWNKAYNENDVEIEGWIVRLRNALQALRQTVIEPTDPLYVEMNQYLNLAGRYYNEGVRTAKNNPGSADALRLFQSARDLTAQVLSTFPGNEAALLLEQKILRMTDRDKWEASARDLVNRARRAVSAGNTELLQGTSETKGLYAQLKVLKEIDPGYPGIDNLIYKSEIVLGLVIPPPDPKVIAQSREYTAQAEKIWANLGVDGSERALELLNKALALWLDNNSASRLKNEILLSSEPEKLPALPPELQNILNLFDQYYEEENYILAKALIDRAVKDFAKYRNDPRITDRKRKVEARL